MRKRLNEGFSDFIERELNERKVYDIRNYKFKRGDELRLLTKPDGTSSTRYKLTVGKWYRIMDVIGSNFVFEADNGFIASLSMDRFLNLEDKEKLDSK